MRLDGPATGATADVAAPVVLAVASVGHVQQRRHVAAAAAHGPAAAGAVIVGQTFPTGPHTRRPSRGYSSRHAYHGIT